LKKFWKYFFDRRLRFPFGMSLYMVEA